jgi:signal transduction histidine kinase
VARALVAITATPLKDADGRITGAIALLRDVTAQRDLEQQLLQSQKMEAIGQLAGGIAHDFNNLLTVIVGCGELALDDLGEAHPSRMNLLELLAASNRATLMTRQLLAFSRQQVVQLQEIQLNDVVAGFESMLRRLIPSRVELAILPRANLSSITADKSQLEQVILNLAINACDAMSNGGTLRIETDEETIGGGAASELGALRGRYVSLTVLDTGTGMSEETRKRIFEPFFTTKELGKGTGLGLSTVYGIVRQSGGVIQVQSAPGQGSEFRILWPRSARHAARPSSIPPRAPWLEKVSILLLEPDDSVRKIAARILRSQGHVVREVAALGEALGIIADTRESFDLLLLEIGQAVPALRDALAASRPNIRQLLLVGGSSGAHYENRSPTQATLLAKPFSRAELLEKIEAALTAEASAQAS